MSEIDIIKAKYKAAWGDLELLKGALDSGASQEILQSCINKVLSSSEVAFLAAKNLMKYSQSEKENGVFFNDGPWFCEQTQKGVHFVLPPMVSKHNKNKAAADGKAIRNLTFELLNKSCDISKLFSFCEISFVFHVGRIGAQDAIPDFDNLDIKSFIDSLQGILIKNDTVLNYDLHAYGVEDTKSFTEVWVIEAEKGVEKGL